MNSTGKLFTALEKHLKKLRALRRTIDLYSNQKKILQQLENLKI